MTTYTPTKTPTTTAAAERGPPCELKPVEEFPLRMVADEEPQAATEDGSDEEYLVDVETHVAVLVQATTPETASAKAVLHTIAPERDGSVTEVSRSVHTCVHSGNEDCEDGCGHDEPEGHQTHEE